MAPTAAISQGVEIFREFVDLNGNTIQDATGHVGFPGFDGMEATVSLSWVAQMQEAGVPVTYWWCYQSDRAGDRKNPQRFDIDRNRNPELMACFVEANKRLKAKLGVPEDRPSK